MTSKKRKSARYNQGKPQANEIYPEAIFGMMRVLTKSREKYARGNWMGETRFSTVYDCAIRHLLKWQAGEDVDEESGESHLSHVMVNIAFLMYYSDTQPHNDDRLFKRKKK